MMEAVPVVAHVLEHPFGRDSQLGHGLIVVFLPRLVDLGPAAAVGPARAAPWAPTGGLPPTHWPQRRGQPRRGPKVTNWCAVLDFAKNSHHPKDPLLYKKTADRPLGPLMVGINHQPRWAGGWACTSHPGVLGSIYKREEGKTGRHPVLKYLVPHGSHLFSPSL